MNFAGFEPAVGVLLWALVMHFLYWGRTRWSWARKVVGWMTWSSQDESALLGIALLADLAVVGLLLTRMLGNS